MIRIATWNIERFKHKDKLDNILHRCRFQKADILVLTEADERVKPDFQYEFHTKRLTEAPTDYHMPGRYTDYAVADYYAPTEHRVSIYTKYPCVKMHETYDPYTSLCVELETEYGNLMVYGTIMGVIGNRDDSFKQAVLRQTEDMSRLSKLGNICICGDFNCSFADNYYFTTFGRETLLEAFRINKIALLTKDLPECIDHIAISQDLLSNSSIYTEEWNHDKTLSDHKGTGVSICIPDHDNQKSFKEEYFALLMWNASEFWRISTQLKKRHWRPCLGGHTPEFKALDDEFDKKLNVLKWKYDIR